MVEVWGELTIEFMKNSLIILLLLSYIDSFGQEILPDSLILKKIYGKTDKGGKTYSCKYIGEDIYSHQDSVVFRIVFKSKINLNNNNYTLAILEAPYGTQHGHQFGYQDLYFLKIIGGRLELVDSIKSKWVGPIGDVSVFELVDIGRNKKALISTFQSTGNHHFENIKIIQLLDLNKLTPLLTINSEYDNSAWKIPKSENDNCEAERYKETFEIFNNNSEWYDIKVHRVEYGFTKGCKDSFITLESDKQYKYFNGEYIEKNN
jgi:hypothetical protein